jgi:hypothetical protein
VAALESLTRVLRQYSHQARILHRLPDGVNGDLKEVVFAFR